MQKSKLKLKIKKFSKTLLNVIARRNDEAISIIKRLPRSLDLIGIARNDGQSLIELMIVIGLLSIILPALLTGFFVARNGRLQQEQRQKATALVREGQEATRVFREADWNAFALLSSISNPPPYHPALTISGSSWQLATGSETGGSLPAGFTRTITILDVWRDNDGNIISFSGSPPAGAINDPSTKKVTTTVSWSIPVPQSVSSTEYLTRNESQKYTETTKDQFDLGTTANVITTLDTDGEVKLGPGGGGHDWCDPATNVAATLNLTHSGVPIAITASTSDDKDIAFTTTGDNASGDAVDKVEITHVSPPGASNPYYNNEAKAYGIYTDGVYVYFNENNPPNHTVRIANANNLSNAGYFDASVRGTGSSVYVYNGVGYTTVENKLFSFDLSTPPSLSISQTEKDHVNLADTGKRVVVVGSNAYVATSNTTSQLQIIPLTSPGHFGTPISINLGNGQSAVDLWVDSLEKFAYIVTKYAPGKNDFFTVDLTHGNAIHGFSTVVSGLGSMDPKGIIVVPSTSGDKAIIVGCNGGGGCSGSGGYAYQVFRVSTPTAAEYCGGMTPAGVTSINAVSGVTQTGGKVFSYIITDNASEEFQIIEGGGGGGGTYASSGIFTSKSTDLGQIAGTNQDVALNSFFVDQDIPASTNIEYYIGLKHNSCTGAVFNFPGDFSGPYSPSSGEILALPLDSNGSGYENPGRCLQYKVKLYSSPDQTQTPVFKSITISFSP